MLSSTESIKTKHSSLLKSTTIVSLVTFLSRILGFMRDIVLAEFFGAQAGMDAFIVAFRIPNFMRRLFAEGAFSQAFVPTLAEYQSKPASQVRDFISKILGKLSFALILITIVGIGMAPLLIKIFAPGFGDNSLRATLATQMLRLTFPFLMFISLTAMSGAILNTYGYFGVPAFTPIFLNLCLIAAAYFLAPLLSFPIVALAWGVLVAGIVQLLFQIPFLWHKKLLVKPTLVWNDVESKKVIMLMIPALFGVSIAQFNLMIDSVFASFLQVGSVSWLYFTDRLTDFPLGVFGVAISTVILPHLSRNFINNNNQNYMNALDWGLRLLLLIGLPAALGLSIFAMPLIAGCFAYGAFTIHDLIQTEKSLITLSIGLPAFMMVKVLASGFYAQQDIKTPVKVGAYTMLLNSVLCALLIYPLKHAGLALASSLASYINCGMLLYLLIKRGYYKINDTWGVFILRLFFANLTLSVYLFLVRHNIDFWVTKTTLIRLGMLLYYISIGCIIYIICLYLVGLRVSHFRAKFKD